MIKLKDLLKESTWTNRKFGEPLPTMDDYKKAHESVKEGKLNEVSTEKVDVEIVVKKMTKDKTWFGPSWAKAIRKKYKKGVSEYDLQMDLPDYIEGGAISKLFN